MGFDCLIERVDHRLTGYDMDVVSLDDAISFLAADRNFHIGITDDDDAYFTVPLQDLLDAVYTTEADWDAIATTLNSDGTYGPWASSLEDAIPVPRYIKTLAANSLEDEVVTRQARHNHVIDYNTPLVFGVDYTNTMVAAFGNRDVVHPNSRPFRRFHQDLTTDHREATRYQPYIPNFENCITISAGLACYSYMDGDTLRAPNGLPSLKMKYNMAKEQMLIDFTPVGDITQVKLSDCTIEINDANYVSITLPEEVDATGKSIITSLWGALHLPAASKIKRVEHNTIIIPPSMMCSQMYHLIYNKIFGKLRYSSVVVQRHRVPTMQFLVDEWVASPTGFLTVVDVPFLYEIVLPGERSLDFRSWVFPKNAKGILRESVTGTIRDYCVLNFKDDTVIGASKTWPLHLPRGDTQNDHNMIGSGQVVLRNSDALFTNITAKPWELFEYATP